MYDAVFMIIIFGDDSLGKTTFIKKILMKPFGSGCLETIGVEFYSKSVFVDGKKIKLAVLELNGQMRFSFAFSNYVKAATGGLFLYDVTNRSSIARIEEWLSIIKKGLKEGDKWPILAVGIVNGDKSKRQISAEEGKEIAKSRNLNGFIECNLKTGKNVEKAFEDLIRLMLPKDFFTHSCKKSHEKISS